MIVKSFTDDIKLIKNHENLILVRDNGFNVLGISPHWEGGGILKSILWNSLKKTEEEISSPTETEDINEPITVIDVYPYSKEKIVTLGPVSTISILGSDGSTDSANFNISTLVLITTSLEQDQLFKLITTALQARSEIICDYEFTDKKLSKSMFTLCPAEENEEMEDIAELDALVYHSVRKATQSSLNDIENSKTVMEFLKDAGIEVNDMVAAGMELLVGVDDQPPIRERLRNQLKLALKDINVIALVIAGLRLEDDFEKHRVKGVNVDDDPAYLYSDEVLGMAIANQIAGTKAIFNFKRYDEAKPGIIGGLGPIMDDVCAGLVAGCMSKIFEES